MVIDDFVFEWDLWNASKSLNKHGVLPAEAESVFYDEKRIIIKAKEKASEERYFNIGKSMESRILTVVFIYRKKKIRIIMARTSSKGEREFYELQKA